MKTFTGGARIGWCNATFPFATLSVSQEKLFLKVSFLGEYEFSPSDIVSLSKYSLIPVLGWGIRIEHTNLSYPTKIIFWCLGSPQTVLDRISATGFMPTALREDMPQRKGFSVRWQAVVAVIVIWNLLFLPISYGDKNQLSVLVLLPLLFALIGGISLLRMPSLQRLVMKPGREIGEIGAWIKLTIGITGFMAVIFGAVLIANNFRFHCP